MTKRATLFRGRKHRHNIVNTKGTYSSHYLRLNKIFKHAPHIKGTKKKGNKGYTYRKSSKRNMAISTKAPGQGKRHRKEGDDNQDLELNRRDKRETPERQTK